MPEGGPAALPGVGEIGIGRAGKLVDHSTSRTHHVSFLCWRHRAQIQEFSNAIVEPVRATDPKVFG